MRSESRTGLRAMAETSKTSSSSGAEISARSMKKAAARRESSRAGGVVSDSMRWHRLGTPVAGAAGALAAAAPSLDSLDSLDSLARDELDGVSSNGGGISTSDDDFRLASDLLLRMSKSVISLEDQICAAAFMGNREVVETLIIQRGVNVNVFGMVSFTTNLNLTLTPPLSPPRYNPPLPPARTPRCAPSLSLILYLTLSYSPLLLAS